jgi:predicted ATPase
LHRSTLFNTTPFMPEYLALCRYTLCRGVRALPKDSAIISSDGVFDYLLDIRAINEKVGRRREELFGEYSEIRHAADNAPPWQFRSMEDYDELRRRNEIRHSTRSAYTARRLPNELPGKSNGESAFAYFTSHIKENALYLLDEPENSLSAMLQGELARFVEDSARFYHCQFVIATHSPFLLSLNGARIYDLDEFPVCTKKWTELAHVRAYYELFALHHAAFES